MGNKSASPFPSFDLASSKLSNEVAQYKYKFSNFSGKKQTIGKTAFVQAISLLPSCKPYFRKFVAPRLFTLVDTKRDDVWDFEEYLSAVAIFKLGQPEEKIRVLYLLYADHKNPGFLTREQLREMIVDSVIAVQQRSADGTEGQPEKWAEDLKELSEGMVTAALYQFAANDSKIDFNEFTWFFKFESSLQGLLTIIQTFLDLGGGPGSTPAAQ